MADLIDRKAFKGILETKSDLLRIGCPENQYGIFLAKVNQMVDILPTVEAEYVVRCRDCKFYTPEPRNKYGWCDRICPPVRPDDFCSRGEKKK